ncbi:unnamed protein product [Gordionus sp. m RMFG-2023]
MKLKEYKSYIYYNIECIQDDHLFFVIPSELTSSPNIKDLAHIPTKSSSDMTSSSNEIDLLDVPSNLPSDMAISPYLADVPSNLPSDMAISPYEIGFFYILSF